MADLTDIVTASVRNGESVDQLIARLTAREDRIADAIRANGMVFGAEPALVAEVIAAIGIGTPPTPEERAYIHTQFEARMRELLEEQRRRQEGEGN